MRRKVLAATGHEGKRHRLENLGDLRRAIQDCFWEVKHGQLPPGQGAVCKAILELLVKLVTESEAEIRARELETKMAQLATLLAEQGKDVPEWALAPLKKELPN